MKRSRKHALAILIVFVLLLGAGGVYAFSTGQLAFEGRAHVDTSLDVRIEGGSQISHDNAINFTWNSVPGGGLPNATATQSVAFTNSGYSHVRFYVVNHGRVPALLEFEPVAQGRRDVRSTLLDNLGRYIYVGHYMVEINNVETRVLELNERTSVDVIITWESYRYFSRSLTRDGREFIDSKDPIQQVEFFKGLSSLSVPMTITFSAAP